MTTPNMERSSPLGGHSSGSGSEEAGVSSPRHLELSGQGLLLFLSHGSVGAQLIAENLQNTQHENGQHHLSP